MNLKQTNNWFCWTFSFNKIEFRLQLPGLCQDHAILLPNVTTGHSRWCSLSTSSPLECSATPPSICPILLWTRLFPWEKCCALKTIAQTSFFQCSISNPFEYNPSGFAYGGYGHSLPPMRVPRPQFGFQQVPQTFAVWQNCANGAVTNCGKD